MKITWFFFLCILPVSIFAQTNDWSAFNQRINAKSYAGKKFKLSAAVKVQLIDPTAEAEIWVRVDKPDNKMGFFYNMRDKPIRSGDWKTVTIEGKIDKDAAYLAFGGLYSRKAIFYFDDFKLSVEGDDKLFHDVPIPNGNFEADSLVGWYYLKKLPGFTLSLTTDQYYEGKKACKVDASTFHRIAEFGTNDSAGKYVNANGIKMYYEEYGQGEPLLLLHGNSESIASFKYQIPPFANHYKVIALDTRGHGQSTEDKKTYSYDLFAEDVNAFLDALHLDSVNVLGWSDGGNTGLILAMRYPQKVKKLITMGANVFIDESVVKHSIFKELHKQFNELKTDTTVRALNRSRLITLLLTEPKHTFEDLTAIKCPVLVMAGEKDVIKPGHTTAIAAHIPHSKLLIAPGETHYYPWENAPAFNKTVLEYLENN